MNSHASFQVPTQSPRRPHSAQKTRFIVWARPRAEVWKKLLWQRLLYINICLNTYAYAHGTLIKHTWWSEMHGLICTTIIETYLPCAILSKAGLWTSLLCEHNLWKINYSTTRTISDRYVKNLYLDPSSLASPILDIGSSIITCH